MSESDFDFFAQKAYGKAVEQDPFLPTPETFFNCGPSWRELPSVPPGWRRVNDGKGPQSGVRVRLPYGEVSLEVLAGEVRILENGVLRARGEHQLTGRAWMSLRSRRVEDGVLYDATVTRQDEDEDEILASWFAPDVIILHRPWWRRWLDRAWPARAGKLA